MLDVTFNEDKARSRTGHGPENMAVVRHFAFNLLRQRRQKKSKALPEKIAAWNPDYLLSLIQKSPVNLDS